MSMKRELARTAATIIKTRVDQGHDAVNVAGGLAFQSAPDAALYRQVATSLWSGDGYYESREDWLARFQENIALSVASDPRFAFQLAAFARDKSGLSLRTSPVALYAEASSLPEAKGTGYIRGYAPKILRRADDPSEALAYLRRHGKVLPHGLVRGISDALRAFDDYQLGKYKETGQIRDMLRLARPKPATEEQRQMWGSALAGTLPVPFTWETELSKAHGDEEKQAAWNRLLQSGKLGIFALLRNIRNMIAVNADIELALEQFTRERTIGSGILPFQFYKGYLAVRSHSREIAEQLLQPLEWCLEGVPKLPGRTLVVTDNSSSMEDTEGTRGLSNMEIGNLMGAMALAICEDAQAGTFGETFAVAGAHSGQSLLKNKAEIDYCGQSTGHSTEAWKIFHDLTAGRVMVDRVVILSDMQCYDGLTAGWNKAIGRHVGLYGGRSMAGELEAYRMAINPKVTVYSINLATQDNAAQFSPDQPVVELGGFSDSVFRFMSAMEAGQDMLAEIRKAY